MRPVKKVNRHHILLLFLLLIGGIMRVSLIPSTVWTGDTARDLLVSKHILSYHEYPVVGHTASGTNPMFSYPAIYYYLLALIQIPSLDIQYVLFVYILLNLVGMAAFYFTVKTFSDRTSAFIATLLFTFSSYYLDRQTTLTSMGFTLPLFLLGTYFHAVGTVKHSLWDSIVGYSFLIISSSINYAALILLPVYVLWTLSSFHTSKKKLLIIGIYICFYALNVYHQFATYIIRARGFDFLISPFLPKNNIEIYNFFASVIFQTWFAFSIIFPALTGIIAIITVFVAMIHMIGHKQVRTAFLYPLSFIGITVLLSAVKKFPVATHYYYLTLPFLFMIIGMNSWRQKKGVLAVAGMLFIAIAIWSGISDIKRLINRNKSFSEASRMVNSIILKIRTDRLSLYFDNPGPFRIVALHFSNRDWESLRFTYFEERTLGKLYTISNESTNNLFWTEHEDRLVMICLIDNVTTLDWCANEMRELYPSAIAVEKLYSIPPYPIIIYYKKTTKLLIWSVSACTITLLPVKPYNQEYIYERARNQRSFCGRRQCHLFA